MLELYARLFAKIKENYALRREIQTRLKPKRRLIRQQIIEENCGACICDLATECSTHIYIVAAGDKKDLGSNILSWRPSVLDLSFGKRDRTDSGESKVTVSSIYSTSTVTSLEESGIKVGEMEDF